MGTGDHAEEVRGMFVSGNYFDLLGADTAMGRTFVPEEDSTPGSHPVVVLSESFWDRRFARSRTTVGSSIMLNGHPFTVVGVVGRHFVGTDPETPEVWVPLMMEPTLAPESKGIFEARDGHWLQLIGRLKPGVSCGILLVAIGVTAGMGVAFAVSRLIARFLYGLNPGDPVTFGGVAAALVAVAIVANYVPARRALRVDPMVALRYE